MALIVSPSASASIQVTQNYPLAAVVETIVSKAGTVTGTAGVGSSLFLQRLLIPGPMNLTEVQHAMSIAFPATNQGAGTMSRSFGLYSFGNSTSLATIFTTSGTSAWSTGTSTTAGATSLTQFQGGWSVPLIQQITFGSTGILPGEYVVGNIFDFAQGSSTWTVNIYGARPASNMVGSAATALTSATLGALSSGGLAAVSAFTGTTAGGTFAAFSTSIIPSMGAMSSAGLVAASGVTGVSSYGAAFIALSTAGSLTAFALSQTVSANASSQSQIMGASASTATVSGVSALALSLTNSAKSVSFQLAGNSANSNIVSSIGATAGSIHSASGSGAAVSAASTSWYNSSYLAASGFSGGSFVGTSGSLGAVTAVGVAALASTTMGVLASPNFGFIGTNSTTSGLPTVFIAGIMSTGALPAAITVTSTAVTYSGSLAFQQPWFALVGS